jgi:general L-amino acid transport system permease protein
MNNNENIPIWRDDRFVKVVVQVVVVFIVIAIFVVLGSNLVRNFQQRGLKFSYGFLIDPDHAASFKIGDAPIPFKATDPFYRALLVGLLNSLRVMIVGIILTTIVGITAGISRLSDNWLLQKIATVYVEIFRNTPLLLQLFFWYFAVFLRLPKIDNPLVVFDIIFLTNRGAYLPFPAATLSTWLSLVFIVLSITGAIALWRRQTQVIVEQGASGNQWKIGSIAIGIAAILTIIFGLDWQQPQFDRATGTFEGGLGLSAEFAALTFGLTIYTAAFVAEVVRAGIQSVGKGQWEAARALGLKPSAIMRLVIFPQALRVMIPPLTSELLNLIKNSSLAIAILYSDIYAVSYTISNQTGKAIEMLLVVMATYLILNLAIASFMNWFNRRIQIIE